MNCRIVTWADVAGPMTSARVKNSLLLRWATNYENEAIKAYYEEGMSWYDDLTEKAAQPLASGTNEALVSEPDHLLRSAA